ncbi:MAG: hypothetical protein U5J62_01505 [Desulfurivibrio sp.]|nr:hypothetical protein [Desulfurivibrio sp.]
MSYHQQQLPAMVRFLLQPEVYPEPAATVELVQTHISYVLLAGDYVYKLKKPVDFGFLDFSSREQRRHYCHEEVRLNRRLCPEIYLDVVTLTRDGPANPEEAAGFALDGAGEAVDYLVKMVRMPAAGMMRRLLERGELRQPHLELIIARLLPFYRQAEGGPEVRELGSAAAVAANVRDNLAQIEPYIDGQALSREQFARLTAFSETFLQNEALFADRQAADRIREGHGDLHSGNICFAGEQVHIFDCIEFNRSFRCGDIADDLAFLVMDLDFHGQQQLAAFVAETMAHRLEDPGLAAMLPFYCCYRACVRGKIGLLTAAEEEVAETDRQQASSRAARYFKLAEHYAQR